ncbi:hypothetical protein J1614_003663 [Plenodomus biglobosus]|nr:hypothetical protein J1614_003663 [Plenodomus biglobosus]
MDVVQVVDCGDVRSMVQASGTAANPLTSLHAFNVNSAHLSEKVALWVEAKHDAVCLLGQHPSLVLDEDLAEWSLTLMSSLCMPPGFRIRRRFGLIVDSLVGESECMVHTGKLRSLM